MNLNPYTPQAERETALLITMSMYLGEKCKYCQGEFATLDDLKTTVWAGDHEYGRLAHEKCWKEHNPQ